MTENRKTPEIPELLQPKVLPALDGLRGISILLVLLSHIYYEQHTVFNIIDLGAVGVEIFFVISGFLITTLLLKERSRTGTINLKYFYIRRAFRILPLVFLFVFVLALLNQLFDLGITRFSFFTTVFFMKNLPFPNSGEWYTGHFWSLSIEEQFYLLFPFLLARMDLRKYTTLLIGLIIFLPTLNYMGYNRVGVFDSNPMVHKITFVVLNLLGRGTTSILIGSLTSILVFRFPERFKFARGHRWLGLALFFIAMSLRTPLAQQVASPYFLNAAFDAMIAVMILVNLEEGSFFSNFLNLRFMARLGVLSYSMYVWQQLFTFNQPWANAIPFGGSPWLNIPLLFGVSYVSYAFFEKKFLDMKRRFETGKKA